MHERRCAGAEMAERQLQAAAREVKTHAVQ